MRFLRDHFYFIMFLFKTMKQGFFNVKSNLLNSNEYITEYLPTEIFLNITHLINKYI